MLKNLQISITRLFILFQRLEWNNVGWVDYNLVLDSKGGPSYSNDATDAPVIMSADYKSFTLTPAYYTLGHLSKFILPGSVRVEFNIFPSKWNTHALAYLRPDNITVISIYNE